MQASAVRVLARDPMLLAIAAVSVLPSLWLMSGFASPATGVLVVGLLGPVFDIFMFWIGFQLSRSPGITVAAKRFWNALALLGLAFLVGDLGQMAHVLLNPGLTDPVPFVWQSIWVLLGIAMPVGVMLTYPQVNPSRQAKIRFWLDASAVLVGAGVFIWFFGGSSAASAIPGSIIALIGAFSCARLLLSGAAPMGAAAAGPILVAAVLQIFSGVLSGDENRNRTALLVLQLLIPAAFTIGPRVQQVLMRHKVDRPQKRPRPYSLLPYLVLTGVFALLPVALPRGLHVIAIVALVGAAVVTTLVVVRQLVVFGEFDTMVARLDASLLEARELEERLRYQTQHDSLTGLANRALFGDRLSEAAAGTVAVLHIDLDGFKAVNDTYGHHAGDAVLIEVAARLRASLPEHGLAARLGGDEFAVLLPGAGPEQAQAVTERFQALLRLPIAVEGRPVDIGASVGMVTGAAGDPEELLRNADEQMYRIKHASRAARLAG